MTLDDTKNIILMLKMNYLSSFKNMTDDEIKAMVKFWHRWFKDYSVEEVDTAVESFINQDANGFCPTVGQIKNIIVSNRHKDDMSPEVAWDCVMKTFNTHMDYKERFESLPPTAQKAIGTSGNLRRLGQCNTEKDLPFEKNSFMRRYKEIQNQEFKEDCIPQVTKKLMERAIKRIE